MALSTRVSYAGTFTPAANSVLLAIVYAVRNGTATPWTPTGITVTGGSLSWTRVAIASGPGVAGDFADSAQAWVAEVGGSPVSMTVTATPTSGDAAYALLNGVVYGWTGYNTADPVGGILQATSGPTDGLWSPTLDAAPATTSEVISVFGGITGGAGNVNPEVGSGWTAVDRLSTTDLYCLETQARRGSTSDVCAWSDTSGPSATTFLYYGPTSIAVEIKGDGLAGIDGASASSAKQGGRLELTGSAFGSPQGKELRLNGVSQSVLSWAETRIVVAVDRALAKYGGTINAEVWDAGVLASNSFALSGGFAPPDGWAYVDIGTPETTAANRLTASPDLATGNQVAYNARGVPSVATAPARVVVDDTGKFYCEPITSFDFEVWTSGDGWGAPATQLIDALSSVYLYEVPEDVDPDDVRLRDPTTFEVGAGGAVGLSDETDTAFALASARQAGLAAETDVALALAARQIAAVGLSLETDTALALAGVQLRAVGRSDETDTALQLGPARPAGLSTETDAALALAGAQARVVGRADETDTAFPRGSARPAGRSDEAGTALALAVVQLRATGRADEVDTAFALEVGVVSGAVGRADEADTAFALAGRQILAAGRADETDAAFARGSARPAGISAETDAALTLAAARPVGLALETDTALALAGRQSAPVGLASETDTAFALGAVAIRGTGLALETDTAFALAGRQLRAVGRADETDTALQLSPAGAIFATETDTALALAGVQRRAVGLSTEADTALALTLASVRAVGLAAETDTALARGLVVASAVGVAIETDTALQLAGRQVRAVGLASEADTAFALAAVAIRPAGFAQELDAALALSARQLAAVGIAVEFDTAQALFFPGFGDTLAAWWRYEVPALGLRYEVPPEGLGYDVPGLGLQFDVPSIPAEVTPT